MPANNEPLTEKFDSLTRIILTEKNSGKLRTACYELYDFFCEIAGFSDSDENVDIQNGTILSNGKAISPVNAARCLWEYKRTAAFLRGILAAMLELKIIFHMKKSKLCNSRQKKAG